MTRLRAIGLALLATCSLTFGAVGDSSAQSRARYQETIDSLRVMLDEQAKLDLKELAAADREDVFLWLDDAERLLSKGDLDGASQLIKRAEYGVELVTATTAASQIQGRAEAQEADFFTAQEQIEALKKEVAELQKKREALAQELTTIK
jgi:hypothetical protein